jgi:hypothetical protein
MLELALHLVKHGSALMSRQKSEVRYGVGCVFDLVRTPPPTHSAVAILCPFWSRNPLATVQKVIQTLGQERSDRGSRN